MNRNIADLANATAYDRDGDKLGSVKEVYINDSTGQPDFVEVGHGLFGMSSSIVPLRGHRLDGENLQLAFSKDHIKDAPSIRDDEHLSEEDHATIYRHFGLDGTPDTEVYERHVFDDDYDRDRLDRDRDYDRDRLDRTGDRFDHDRDREREGRDAELRDQELIDPVTGQGMPGDPIVAPGVVPVAPAPGTDVHGFGDHAPDSDASADRLRAESDHRLGLDRTPEDRAARGTSAHGMSDEPREQLRDYDTAERDYAKDARTDRDLDRDDLDRDSSVGIDRQRDLDRDRDRDLDRDRERGRGARLRRYRVQAVDSPEEGVRHGDRVDRDEVDPSLRAQHDPREHGNVDADGRPLYDGDEQVPRSKF